MTVTRRRSAAALLAVLCSAGTGAIGIPTAAARGGSVDVQSGETWTVARTTQLHRLTVEADGAITAPDGYDVTLTVDGVETGQVIPTAGAVDTVFTAGTYTGDVVLTVTAQNPVTDSGLTYPFRQALYVDSTGVVNTKSVLAAVRRGRVSDTVARNVRLVSTGEAFNGVYVSGGSYALQHPTIKFTGNGRSDFAGYGASVMGTNGARLVVDKADIDNTGTVRAGVVAAGGSNVVVKNSRIATHDGTLPAGYQPTVDTSLMEQVPWMLSLSGNVRATNLLGTNTKATYLNDKVSSTGWGVLSTDNGQDGQLTSINSDLAITGADGYGSYAIGNATERFLGTRENVATYALINRGGAVHYGDSTRSAVAALNTSLDLGLTSRELRAIPRRNTVINSRRFGMMWHGAGTVAIDGGTVVNTKEATFLDKGQQIGVDVDGSSGARLNPANGVLLQLMEDDDPGPQMVNGKLLNTGVYHEPTTAPTKVDSFDTTVAHDADATTTFADIALKGDFYNGMRGGSTSTAPGPGAGVAGKNLVLTLNNASLRGVVSASTTRHHQDTIAAADYEQLGEVTNTVSPVVNNGVVVTVGNDSRWTVTGTSYLSKLTVAANGRVTAPAGKHLTLRVDGVKTVLVPGATYTGAVTLTVG
ncbi:hypothetical protein SAMN05443575_3630 [Jatrophihabitans endophyticus]|uniref:Right handed beta helix region n=1 Tax=Jatrophihabitans endophyticus TaxID=1206085 RepID=A0A1M5RS27_9ACTN|nr:hypothetical protein [Jatrophihabitans endophyticus]SHH29046.1 hypothetical protein SAMN05443575_3630 [Jatrophihabitans endophyticus]